MLLCWQLPVIGFLDALKLRDELEAPFVLVKTLLPRFLRIRYV